MHLNQTKILTEIDHTSTITKEFSHKVGNVGIFV